MIQVVLLVESYSTAGSATVVVAVLPSLLNFERAEMFMGSASLRALRHLP